MHDGSSYARFALTSVPSRNLGVFIFEGQVWVGGWVASRCWAVKSRGIHFTIAGGLGV